MGRKGQGAAVMALVALCLLPELLAAATAASSQLSCTTPAGLMCITCSHLPPTPFTPPTHPRPAAGLGGNLSIDEVNVIRGALDMTVKTVQKSMTPLDKAFMLSTDDRLDEVGGQGRHRWGGCRCDS